MVSLVLIGNGRWGKRYISTLSQFSNVRLKIANRDNWKGLVNETPDGVIICTPPDSHIEIAEYVLTRNIPAMIEKPLSLSLIEAERLKKYTAPILINHIHLFADAYQKIKKAALDNKITFVNSTGYGKGPIRTYSSLWDYGPHDISMILDLAGSIPNKVTITELKLMGPESLFDIEMDFGSFRTKSLVGNGADNSARSLTVNFEGMTISYDNNSISSEDLPPLTNAINVFMDAIHGKKDERLGLDLSLKVMKVLEHCQLILDQHTNS